MSHVVTESFHARFENAAPVQIPAWVLPLLMAQRERTYTRSGYKFDVEILTDNLANSGEGFAETARAQFLVDGRVVLQYKPPVTTVDLDDTLTISVDYLGDEMALDLGILHRPQAAPIR